MISRLTWSNNRKAYGKFNTAQNLFCRPTGSLQSARRVHRCVHHQGAPILVSYCYWYVCRYIFRFFDGFSWCAAPLPVPAAVPLWQPNVGPNDGTCWASASSLVRLAPIKHARVHLIRFTRLPFIWRRLTATPPWPRPLARTFLTSRAVCVDNRKNCNQTNWL